MSESALDFLQLLGKVSNKSQKTGALAAVFLIFHNIPKVMLCILRSKISSYISQFHHQ